jgi:hypothetical protein
MSKALVAAAWVLLFVSGLFALYMLFVGLTFGFALWQPDNPKPTMLWLGVLAAPILVTAGLRQRYKPIMLAFALVAACILDAAWIVPAFTR